MNRSECLFEKWAALSSEAEVAILVYDEGDRQEGMKQFKHIWQRFQAMFAAKEDRISLEEAYQDTMNMLLNRMYLELEETESDEVLWEFCSRVCDLLGPDEIWREDYAVCIGRLLQKKKEYEACDQWFVKCQKEEPVNPAYAAYHAACLAERGEMKRALAMLDESVQHNPKCTYTTLRFYRLAARLYEQWKQNEMAALCKQRICELDRDLLLFSEEER